MTPELIQRAKSFRGGPCVHCRDNIGVGGVVVKMTFCCDDHPVVWKEGFKNGPGVWVCENCSITLLVKEIHDG